MNESPLCSTGLGPFRGCCPASPHSNSLSCKAGQRVLQTTYCPWATGWFFSLIHEDSMMLANFQVYSSCNTFCPWLMIWNNWLIKFLFPSRKTFHSNYNNHLRNWIFWAAAPKGGQSPEEHKGTFVPSFFCLSVHLSPSGPIRPEIHPLRPKICPLRP